MDDDLVGRRVDLGHPGLARVEQVDRLLDELAASVSAGDSSPRRSHSSSMLRLEISHGRTLARRSPTSANRSIGWTTATRTWPAPSSP